MDFIRALQDDFTDEQDTTLELEALNKEATLEETFPPLD